MDSFAAFNKTIFYISMFLKMNFKGKVNKIPIQGSVNFGVTNTFFNDIFCIYLNIFKSLGLIFELKIWIVWIG